MTWDKSNFACWGTYRCLAAQHELDPLLVSFAEAESFKMPGLAFYVLGAGKDDLDQRAELVAMELFNFLVVNYSPTWQGGEVNSTREALNMLIPVLVDKDKTIADLAATVDDIFKFSNE